MLAVRRSLSNPHQSCSPKYCKSLDQVCIFGALSSWLFSDVSPKITAHHETSRSPKQMAVSLSPIDGVCTFRSGFFPIIDQDLGRESCCRCKRVLLASGTCLATKPLGLKKHCWYLTFCSSALFGAMSSYLRQLFKSQDSLHVTGANYPFLPHLNSPNMLSFSNFQVYKGMLTPNCALRARVTIKSPLSWPFMHSRVANYLTLLLGAIQNSFSVSKAATTCLPTQRR